MRSPRALLAVGLYLLCTTTSHAEDVSSVVSRLRALADSGSYAEYSAALAEAKGIMAGDARLVVFEDIDRVWQYRLSDTIGAFFDDASSNGLFSQLVARYPGYLPYIEKFAIHANLGRTLYPTAETLEFLKREAAEGAAPPRAVVPGAEPPRVQPSPQPPSQPQPASRPQPVPGVPSTFDCANPVAVTAIATTQRGLQIKAAQPLNATASQGAQSVEELPVAVAMLTVDIPYATLSGIGPRLEWPTGPFESARIVRYQNASGCGLRLRLQPRIAATWYVVPDREGVAISFERIATQPETLAEESQRGGLPGMANVTATLSGSKDGAHASSSSSGFFSGAFAQQLSSGPVIRGFVTQITPSYRDSAAPFGAIGIGSIGRGPAIFGAAAGDLVVNLGDTGETDVASITSSVFRGAGVTARTRDAALEVFGGLAASSSLIRVGLDSTYRPDSHDRLFGLQASWIPAAEWLAAAAGALETRSPFADGPRTLNLFEAAELHRSPSLRFRVLTEQSRAHDTSATGFATTVDTHWAARDYGVNGYYRWLSPHFRPAGGSGFYANLRRSYGLLGTLHRDRWSAAAAASQAKVFSILDPADVGSLTTTRSAEVTYRLTKRVSIDASHGETSIRSDPGATIRADSTGKETGVGASFGLAKIDGALQISDSTTRNEADRSLDFSSHRIDLSVHSAYGRDVYGRFSVAKSERSNGTSAGADHRGVLGGALLDRPMLSVYGEAGVSVTPAGVAQSAFRQTFGTLRITPRSTRFSGALQITWERVKSGNEEFDAVFASISTQKMLRWGEGRFPSALFETRSMRLNDDAPFPDRLGQVEIVVFEDSNQNGVLDPGERPITPAFVSIGGRTFPVDSHGQIVTTLTPSKYDVELLPRGAVFGYFIPAVMKSVTVDAAAPAVVAFGLRPAGRVRGALKPQGEVDPKSLASRYVRIIGPVERQAVTDSDGSFDFGFLPEGDYRVSAIAESLREGGLAPVAPVEAAFHLTWGAQQQITLIVRRLSARERFGS